MAESGKARVVGFNHVALEVGDIEEALAFYGRLFEFKLRGKSEAMAFIDLGDQFLALQKGRRQPFDDGRHFGWWSMTRRPRVKRWLMRASRPCLVRFSTFSTLGATALRLSAMPMFNSRRRRMCCGAWASRTCRRTRRRSKNSRTKAWRRDEAGRSQPLR